MHGRHGAVVRRLQLVEPAVELERIEARSAHDGRAGRQRSEQAGHDAVDVEQRHHVRASGRHGVSCRWAAMLRAEAARLRCRKGTIFGREVVPDVWSTSAWSSPVGRRSLVEEAGREPAANEIDRRDPAPCTMDRDRRPRVRQPQPPVMLLDGDHCRRAEIIEVEPELVFAVLRVQGRRASDRHDGEEDQRHLRPVGEHDGDAIARAEPGAAQLHRRGGRLHGPASRGRSIGRRRSIRARPRCCRDATGSATVSGVG